MTGRSTHEQCSLHVVSRGFCDCSLTRGPLEEETGEEIHERLKHILTHLANKNFLSDALDQAQTARDTEQPDRQRELVAVEQELHKAHATINRYLRAFETASIPEDVCGERLRDLREQAARLTDHRAQLSDEVAEPERPSLDELERLAVDLAKALAHDDSPRIKDVLRRVIDHIAVESRDKLHPVIRVPLVRIQGDQVARSRKSGSGGINW